MNGFSIRAIRPGDEDAAVALLRELAEYEKLLDRFHITAEVIRRDYLCDRPLLQCELGFEGDAPAGIASWQWTYGSFAAIRKIYLADLYVKPAFRGKGYGKALLAAVARHAVAEGGGAVEWEVLDWNTPSIAFYESLGATAIRNWFAFQLSGDALARLAKP